MNNVYKILITLLIILLSSVNLAFLEDYNMSEQKNNELATFGGGCFWCTEAIFQELEGVVSVEAGYAGGQKEFPTYEEVCAGATGHAEIIRIEYDPKKINFELLLEVFFKTHNPTTLNRQGADVGTQYRSVVFYHNNKQKLATEQLIDDLTKSKVYEDRVVTEIVPINNYYPAENYHQDYFANNPTNAYCNAVINPKLTKFMKAYKDKLKK